MKRMIQGESLIRKDTKCRLPVLRSHLKFTTNVILYLVLYHKGKEIYKNNGK